MKNPIREISLEVLQRRVLAAVRPTPTESIQIERSRGRILAEVVRAPGPFPPLDKAAMDGFALIAADVESASSDHPTILRIVGTVAAGAFRNNRLRHGEAVRIMTGAPLPPGADCVVKIEDVTVRDENVRVSQEQLRHRHVLRRGVDMRRGQVILRPGTVIGPAQMAMLALLDRRRVAVHRRPRVGILSTGDELGEVGQARPHGHVPDSNRYGLLGLVESAGCIPVDGGRCPDDPDKLHRAVMSLAKRSDFIVTTGGVSAGDYDVVKILFREAGGVALYRVPMKPGKPQAFGHVGGKPFFGLPGNPVSAMVVFDFLVRPALRKMAGARAEERTGWPAIAACDFPRKSRQWEFPRVRAEQRDRRWIVTPVASQRSSDLKSMTDADGYAVLSPDHESPKAGDTVLFVPFVK